MGGIGEDGTVPDLRTAAGWPSHEAQLSEDAVRVFRWVSDQGSCDAGTLGATLGLPESRAASAVATLTELLLLRRLPGDPAQFVAMAPDAALAALVAPREAGLRRQLAEIDRLRAELSLLAPFYTEGRRQWQGRAPLTEITDLKTVVGMIAEATMRCRKEVRTCHPGGGRSPALLEQAFVQDHDPRCHADPGTLDPDRGTAARHLSFGLGPHYCPGSALARLELTVALTAVLGRWSRLEPAVPLNELSWGGGYLHRRLAALPLRPGSRA